MRTLLSLANSHAFRAKTHYFNRLLAGLGSGLICAVGGIVLCLHGAIGKTSWTAKFLGASSEISDAPPGVVLFIAGLFVVYVTRFRVKSKR
jgi:hypothetical protein